MPMTELELERLNQSIEAYKAFKDGKPVQWTCKGLNYWMDGNNPAFSLRDYDYRPKPEPVRKLVPFTMEEWRMKIGQVVILKDGNMGGVVNGWSCISVVIGNTIIPPISLCSNYVFADGSPCGKYVEE